MQIKCNFLGDRLRKLLILLIIAMVLITTGCSAIIEKKVMEKYEEADKNAHSEVFYDEAIGLFNEIKLIDGYEKYVSEEECNKYIDYLTTYKDARELSSGVIFALSERISKGYYNEYTPLEIQKIEKGLSMLKDLKSKENIEKYIDLKVLNTFIEIYEDTLSDDDSSSESTLSYADKKKAKQEGVRIGMTQQEVLNSNWGKPEDVNTTTTAYGTSEQWVYDGYKYLYFEDGLLTTIQE